MAAEPSAAALSRRDARAVAVVVAVVLAGVMAAGYLLQAVVQRGSLTSADGASAGLKQQREVDKLTAEVKQIRSDTGGSLYWLKLAAVFVTVGAGVGGYLIAHSRSTRERLAAEDRRTDQRLAFERRGQVDAAYQAMVLELSSSSAILRANAAMKLGNVLQSPPVEWHLEDERRDEIWALTKQLLAASLAIEKEPKVLKALTIAVALHAGQDEHGDLRGLDFSLARAADAYWARIDFRYADFYKADLTGASLRKAKLGGAQFRETVLQGAVLVEATCEKANFKFTDLRNADLSGADLTGASFERAKVHGVVLAGATLASLGEHVVDLSERGDGSELQSVGAWVSRSG
jgi:Pentapeptide repeats (8 copies)